LINREVVEFHNLIFEPNQGKFCVHTTFKKELRHGEKQFSNDPNRLGAELYQAKTDALLGFNVKHLGLLASEKVKEVHFSCVGNIFASIEQDGLSRHSLNFYMIAKHASEGKVVETQRKKGAEIVQL